MVYLTDVRDPFPLVSISSFEVPNAKRQGSIFIPLVRAKCDVAKSDLCPPWLSRTPESLPKLSAPEERSPNKSA